MAPMRLASNSCAHGATEKYHITSFNLILDIVQVVEATVAAWPAPCTATVRKDIPKYAPTDVQDKTAASLEEVANPTQAESATCILEIPARRHLYFFQGCLIHSWC